MNARGATEMDDARCASDMGDVRGTTDSEMDDDAPRGATEMGNALCRANAATRLGRDEYG